MRMTRTLNLVSILIFSLFSVVVVRPRYIQRVYTTHDSYINMIGAYLYIYRVGFVLFEPVPICINGLGRGQEDGPEDRGGHVIPP